MAMDKLAVNLGAKLLELIPGSVHTEVDIRQSYNTEESIARAKRLVEMYKEMGIDKDRVVIKLAGTWEGIQAARVLEKEGIRTNITLVFSFLQVAAAAQAGCFTVSSLSWTNPRLVQGKVGTFLLYSSCRSWSLEYQTNVLVSQKVWLRYNLHASIVSFLDRRWWPRYQW